MSGNLLNCNKPFEGLYLEFAVACPLFIVLQTGLLLFTIRHEWKNRHNEKYIETNTLKTRLLYILLQFIGLFWMITDLFRFVIHPQNGILEDGDYIGCQLVAHIPKGMPVPFYSIYLYQILLRMDASFRESYLEINKTNIHILTTLIFLPILLAYAGFFILTIDAEVCVHNWEPIDADLWTNSEGFGYCDFPISTTSMIWYGTGIGWIPVLNLIFGIIFAWKLNKILGIEHQHDRVKRTLKLLIVKVCILTLAGSLSTPICFILWLFYSRQTFLYLDLFVNSLMIGLMFTYNDKYYKRCCKCFIILCLTNIDKSQDKMDREEVYHYADYRNDDIDLSKLSRMATMDTRKDSQKSPTESRNSAVGYDMNNVVDLGLGDDEL